MELFRKAWQFFRKYKWILFLCYVLTLVMIGFNMINPYLTKILFDRVFEQREDSLLIPLLTAMIAVTVIRHAITFTKAYLLEKYTVKSVIDLRAELLRKFFKMSFETFNKAKTGDLLTLLTQDAENLKNIFASTLPLLFEYIFSFVFASVVLFRLDPIMTLITYLCLPPVVFFSRRYSKRVRPLYTDIRAQASRLSTVAQENLNGVRIVRAFARESFEEEKFDRENKKFTLLHLDLVKAWAKQSWKMTVMSNFPYLSVLLVGGIFVIRGRITIGTLVAFTSYIVYLSNPINLLSGLITSFQNAAVSGEKLFEFLDREPAITSPADPAGPSAIHGDLAFEQVTLVRDGKRILDGIDLSLPLGSKLGILGATGSGKTSLVNMVPRFFDCTEGRVTLDGIDVRDYDLRQLREAISFVSQDVFLFSNTVDSNIAFQDETMPDERVVSSAVKADADGFIRRLNDGYQTVVGERGIGLSGGQKQRISMARAFSKEAPILILDDSTSALDNETEQVILEHIRSSERPQSLLIVASRVSSVQDADLIIVLDHGRILERGTHSELIAANGRYAKIYREQYGDSAAEILGGE